MGQKRRKDIDGIKKAVIKKNITHDDYKEYLFSRNKQMRKMNVIRHEVFTKTINKIALSANDDKRIIGEDKISTFAHGHYRSAD